VRCGTCAIHRLAVGGGVDDARLGCCVRSISIKLWSQHLTTIGDVIPTLVLVRLSLNLTLTSQVELYTPIERQLGTKEVYTVLGHVYVAGTAAFGYGVKEDGRSIFSVTLTGAVDVMIGLDPARDGLFGASS